MQIYFRIHILYHSEMICTKNNLYTNILLLALSVSLIKVETTVHFTSCDRSWNQRLSRHLRREFTHLFYTDSTCHPDNVCPRGAAWKMSFFSEEVESQCRIRSTRRGKGGRAEKENNGGGGGTRFRSHIGSDTSNPEATLQIPPSCWTSCSLHNRIRMNRPSPALVLLFSIFLHHSASLFILSSLLELVLPFFLLPIPMSPLFSVTPVFSLPSFARRFIQLPSFHEMFFLRNGCLSILPSS